MNRRQFVKSSLRFLSAFGASYVFLQNSYSAGVADFVLSNRSFLTPEIIDEEDYFSTLDGAFHKSNNLRRRQGSPFLAIGEYLEIKGRITDVMDNPVNDAIVYIWQTNHKGFYNFNIPQTHPAYDKDFSSCGICKTDSLGNYSFITIFPGANEDRAPHVNFRVYHKQLKSLQTQMFFSHQKLNSKDRIYQSLQDKDKELVTAKVEVLNPANIGDGKVAFFDIKLDGILHYRRI